MTQLSAVDRYLHRHALDVPEHATSPAVSEQLRLVIVIPAMAESEGIGAVLDSLEQGSERLGEAECVVVVNNPTDAPEVIKDDNLRTLSLLEHRKNSKPRLLVLDRSCVGKAFDPQTAGVGLARRVGMDLALRRLVDAGHVPDGAIACLDGDSPVEPGYVDAVLDVFGRKGAPLGGVCTCEHPIPTDPVLAKAIVAYETWMRYFELGLRFAGSPFSYPTIGSSLVASAEGYAMADGMPTRQAAEDFYFAQKLIKLSRGRGLEKIRNAVVHPAARLSHRVPFGTGRAMRRCMDEGTGSYLYAEPSSAFFDLRRWFSSFEEGFFEPSVLERQASSDLLRFLQSHKAFDAIDRIRANSRDSEAFAFGVHSWFDGLKCVRFAHECKRTSGGKWIFDELLRVIQGLEPGGRFEHMHPLAEDDASLQAMIHWLDLLRMID